MAVGCSMQRPSEVWTDAVLEAQTLNDSGDSDRALKRLQQLEESAPDQHRQRWVTFEKAQIQIQLGDEDRALQLFEKLYASELVDSYGARAKHLAARIHEERSQIDEATRLRFRAIARYPNEMGAEWALDDLIAHHRANEEHQTVSEILRNLYPEVRETYLADNVLYELAMNEDTYLDDPDSALDTLRTLYANHPDQALADDALWEMAQIYRRHQRWEAALHNLDIIASNVETSWFVGDYNSQWLDDAVFDMGMINLLFVKDYDAAVEHFNRYVKDFEFSLLADDAAWHACEARRLQRNDAQHLQCLKRFLENHPESRYVERAAGRLGLPSGSP